MENQGIFISDQRSVQEINHLYSQMFQRLRKFIWVPREYRWLQKELKDDLSDARVFWHRFQVAPLRSRELSMDSAEAIVETILDRRDELLTKMTDSVDKAVPEVRRLLDQIRNHREDLITSQDFLRDMRLLRQNFADILKVFNFFNLIEFSRNNHYHMMENFTTIMNPIILELMQEIFIKLFQKVQWPVITYEDIRSDVQTLDSFDAKRRDMFLMNFLFGFLIELKTGVYVGESVYIDNNVVKNLPIFIPDNNDERWCFPMKLMVQPLFKRFENLFSNREELRSDDQKDHELLFLSQMTHLKLWIVKNASFFHVVIDSMWSKHFDSSESSRDQFIRILLGLFHEKLETILPKMADSKNLPSFIYEITIFDNEINKIDRDFFKKNPSLNSLDKVFEDPLVTERYIEMEKNELEESMESIINTESYWCLKPPQNNECDNFLVCEVADLFRIKIQDLIFHVEFVPVGVKPRFFYLIMNAFNHFRRSLSSQFENLDLKNWPLSQKFFYILRSLVYSSPLIESVPINLFFPSWNRDEEHIKVQIQTTIKDLLKTYEDNIAEIFKQLDNVIISDFMSDLSDYKNLSWDSMSCSIDRQMQMTTEAEKLFKVMAKIDSVKEHVSRKLYEDFSSTMKTKIQDILLEQFILKTNFNRPAIDQLKFDLAHGLSIPEPRKKPKRVVHKIVEYFNILELPGETRQNLRERFETSSKQEFKASLKTLKIFTLKPKTVIEIIDKQTPFLT